MTTVSLQRYNKYMSKGNNQALQLFHGSDHVIEQPEYGGGSANNDYGRGFYCTKSEELAKEWACGRGGDGFANEYLVDITGLDMIDLNSSKYCILNWLAVLTHHRTYWQNRSISADAKAYLQDNFYVDISRYDIVKGYGADDSYFTFAQDFVSNAIPLDTLRKAMHIGELGEQIVIKSKRSFERIDFTGSTPADASIYYEKKTERDRKARLLYRKYRSELVGTDGIYMLDIVREGMKNGDPRLQ